MMIRLMFALLAAQGCHAVDENADRYVAVAPEMVTVISGSTEHVNAFLAELSGPRLRRSEQIVFIGRTRGADGGEELRYQMPRDLPYREVGGMIFVAQRHGLAIRIEAPEASNGR